MTLGAQVGLLGFAVVMMHVTDGVAETRNPDTLAALALVLLLLLVLSAAYNHLRAALLGAAAERFGLRLRAAAMQAAIRNAVRTDPGSGLAVMQDIHRVGAFLAGGSFVAGLELVSAVVAILMLFALDTGLGLLILGGVALAASLGAVMHRATARPVAEARERMLETSAELGGQLVHPDLSRGIGLLPATLLRWRGRYEEALPRPVAGPGGGVDRAGGSAGGDGGAGRAGLRLLAGLRTGRHGRPDDGRLPLLQRGHAPLLRPVPLLGSLGDRPPTSGPR